MINLLPAEFWCRVRCSARWATETQAESEGYERALVRLCAAEALD